MKLSQMFLPTLREVPSDADTVSMKFMMRAGMIRKLSSGLYDWLPLGLKVLKKAENIIREEMNNIGGQEVLFPILLPKELWEETGRWQVYGKELFRIKDRKDSEFCLGPTHEEAVTDLARREVRSYRQLPIMFYQFGIKFRDEIRPRFGVMRAREFYMKDAYSFHGSEQEAEDYYRKVFDAYSRICDRCGFKYRAVEAATGAIGGKYSHEFMVLAETGEEEIATCKKCTYTANTEKFECAKDTTGKIDQSKAEAVEEINTPNMRSVEEVSNFMKENVGKFIKSLLYVADGRPVLVLVRGDYEINEAKLASYLGSSGLVLADNETIEKVTGAPVGFAGPVGLKQKVRIVADYSVECLLNAVSGANKKDYHLKNINIGRDFTPSDVGDLRKVTRQDLCPKCGSSLDFHRGIEIGHTFKLGYKYSKSMKAMFLTAEGKQEYFIMGCYGIGVSRIVAAAIEQSYDENGIIWQNNLAPFHVYLMPVDYNDTKIRPVCDEIYGNLTSSGYDVLLDDRNERPGVKFKDADLIGIPVRVVISTRNLPDNVEIKLRREKESRIIPLSSLPDFLKSLNLK